jgi:hypothetical protein
MGSNAGWRAGGTLSSMSKKEGDGLGDEARRGLVAHASATLATETLGHQDQ